MKDYRLPWAGIAGRIAIVIIALALLGCAGSERGALSGVPSPPVAGGLPPIPLDVPGHTTAVIQNVGIDGADAFSSSPGCVVQGTTMRVWTVADEQNPQFEWALYRYTPAVGETVQRVDFDINVVAGVNSWLGIANYGTLKWQFEGPFNTSGFGDKFFDDLELGGYLSPGGNLYFLVAAWNGGAVTCNGVDITTDVPQVQTYTVSGRVVDSSTSQGMPGITVTLTQTGNPDQTDVTDNQGQFSFTGLLEGTYSLLPLTIPNFTVVPAPGYPNMLVGPSDQTGKDYTATPDAPPGVTYETGAGIIKGLIDDRCTYCHSDTGDGPNQLPFLRNYTEVFNQRFNIKLRVVTLADMPDPPKSMTQDERDLFVDWENNGFAQ